MLTDDLLIASSSSFSKVDYIPLLISSTAETPELNTNIPSKLAIKGERIIFNLFTALYKLPITNIVFSELTTISDDYALNYAFSNWGNLTEVKFPKLTTISGNYALNCAFDNCSKLTSISFPKLTTVTYPKTTFFQAGSSSLTIHLPKALSSLGITNNDGSNSSSYCKFAYDL